MGTDPDFGTRTALSGSAKSGSVPIFLHHVNLQTIVGGGEIYTRALTRALLEVGAKITLYVHPANRFWDEMRDRVSLVHAENEAQLLERLPAERSVILTHNDHSAGFARQVAQSHLLAGFAHLPVFDRSVEHLRHYRLVATVSRYCIELLRKAGIGQVYPEPMYGIAEGARGDPEAPIVAGSEYQWDQRKMRDVLLGAMEPALAPFRKTAVFQKRPGLTLGIVSLLVPIKQFPLLFSHLAPILAKHQVNLEIFGACGYAQVRDLKRSLRPMRDRVRVWGYQKNVAAIYPQLDYLLTGLPEKEALGLNVLEAQICGTPVLAPRAPPFTETMLDGASGFLYRDPRQDGGRHFGETIDAILAGRPRPDPRVAAREHLAEFSYPALVARARSLIDRLDWLEAHPLA